MKPSEFSLWNMNPEPEEGSLIKCPECHKWTSHERWTESEVPCDDCGSHSSIRCPECLTDFDHINGPIFETKMSASIKTYNSFADLKRDRVVRPIAEKERLRQGKAVQSLKENAQIHRPKNKTRDQTERTPK